MTLLDDQRRFWDRAAEEKTFTTPFRIDAFQRYVSRNMSVLDVGCGYGRTLNELKEHGYADLTGVDFSGKMIDRGRKLYPRLNLRVMEHGDLPFEDGTFDAVILLAVLTCIAQDEEQIRLVADISRVLKPGGILYINDFLINSDERNTERYRKFEGKYDAYGTFELPEGAVVRHHSMEHVAELTAGFERLTFETLIFTTMNGNRSNGFYYMGRKRPDGSS